MSFLVFPNEIILEIFNYISSPAHISLPLLYANRRLANLLSPELIDEIFRNRTEQEGKRALYCAAKYGNRDAIQGLLGRGLPEFVEVTEVLHELVNDSMELGVRALLEFGIDPESTNSNGRTALLSAASRGCAGVVSVLLEREDLDVNAVSAEDGETVLSLAVGSGDEETVKILLQDERVDVNPSGKRDNRPIHRAAAQNRVNILPLLLADDRIVVNATNSSGETPLHCAVRCNAESATKILMQSPRVDQPARTKKGLTILHYAASWNRESILADLLADPTTDPNVISITGDTPLHLAARLNLHRIAAQLLSHPQTSTVVHAVGGDTALDRAIRLGRNDMVRLLLTREVSITWEENDKVMPNYVEMPFSMAAERGWEGVIRLLLKSRKEGRISFDVNAGRLNPLWASLNNGFGEIAKMLLELDEIDVCKAGPYGRCIWDCVKRKEFKEDMCKLYSEYYGGR